jgi:hypothetical protein
MNLLQKNLIVKKISSKNKKTVKANNAAWLNNWKEIRKKSLEPK